MALVLQYDASLYGRNLRGLGLRVAMHGGALWLL